MLNVIIVDDELPSRMELTSILEKIKDLKIVATCSLGQEALDYLQNNQADLIFLDIEMPQITGLEVAKIIRSTIPNPPAIIFSTGFSEFAVTAFELNAFDYILKPYTTERILTSIMRFRNQLKQRNGVKTEQLKLPVWKNDKAIVLNAEDDIILIQSGEQQTEIYTENDMYEISTPLKELETKLQGHGFLRTHKSFIININKVREVTPWFNDTYVLTLDKCPIKDIPVSRHYMQEFKNWLNM